MRLYLMLRSHKNNTRVESKLARIHLDCPMRIVGIISSSLCNLMMLFGPTGSDLS